VADEMVMLLLACRTWHPLQVAMGSPNGGTSDPTLESYQRNAVQTSINRVGRVTNVFSTSVEIQVYPRFQATTAVDTIICRFVMSAKISTDMATID